MDVFYRDDVFDYIRQTYKVPAWIGARIRYTGSVSGKPIDGTIVGVRGMYLLVTLDLRGRDDSVDKYVLHPTWKVEYLS